jgi:methionine-rich copper-binding protein CopC
MMRRFPIERRATLFGTLSLAALLILTAIAPSLVAAHAELDAPTPADGSTVIEPVVEVAGTFTQRVRADGSRLVVKDASGATVAQGGRDPERPRRMVAVPATPLGDGTYRVEWTTISADDDELARGTWSFTVAVPASPSPTPVATAVPSAAPSASTAPTAGPPTPTPSVAPTAGPTPQPSGDGEPASGVGDVLLPIIVVLVLLGGGAAYLFSRRDRPAAGA